MSVEVEGVDNFEKFSLRMARAVLISSIALGCVVIVGGLLTVVWALVLMPGPTKGVAPSAPVPGKLTMALIEKWQAEHATTLHVLEQDSLRLDEPGEIPATLQALFPSPPYSTSDVWESYCQTPSDYGCLQKGRRLKVPSAARTFTALFKGVDDQVRAGWLPVLTEHLAPMPVERRLDMVAPTMMAHREVKKQNQAANDAYEASLKETDETFTMETAAHRRKVGDYSTGALGAAAWGFAAVVSASIFVALLAIERHLRELRRRRDADVIAAPEPEPYP